MVECRFECIYRKDNIDLIHDSNADLFYLRTYSLHTTPDYTKQEIVAILKDMIEALEE